MLFFGSLLLIGLAGILVYVLMVYRAVPGAVDERLGKLEDIPEDVGQWKPDVDSAAAQAAQKEGLVREQRLFYQEAAGWFGKEQFIQQARYRDADSGAIVRVDPDAPRRRRRIRTE